MSCANYPTDVTYYGSRRRITRDTLNDLKIANAKAEMIEDELGVLVLQIKTAIVTAHTPFYKVEYPADWWQAFKDRWFPAWAKRRWIVKTKVILVSFDVLYPELATDDRHGHHIVTAVVK